MANDWNDDPRSISLSSVKKPLTMFQKRGWQCSMFLVPNLILGPLGVYLALLIPLFSASYTFQTQFGESLKSGALYTFTIAFLVSTAAFLLQGQSQRTVEHVRRWKAVVVLMVFVLVVVTGMCAGLQQAFSGSRDAQLNGSADNLQMILCGIGVCAAIYCFLLAIYEEELDDFAAIEAEKREELAERASTADSDGRGMDL